MPDEVSKIGKAIDGISKSMLIYQDSISVGTVYHFQSAVLVRINLIRLKSFCQILPLRFPCIFAIFDSK